MQDEVPVKQLDAYLTMTPSGLETFTMKAISDALSKGSYICQMRQVNCQPSDAEIETIKERLLKQQEKKRARKKNNKDHPICGQPTVGTSMMQRKGKEREVNIGFHEGKSIVSFPGNLEGKCIIQFNTDAPPSVVASLRPMGSGQLLAIITSSDSKQIFKNDDSLEDAIASLSSHLDDTGSNEYNEQFYRALDLWGRHVQQVWSKSIDIKRHLQSPVSKKRPFLESRWDDEEDNDSMHDLRKHFKNILHSDKQLKYRVSCLRAHTKDYKYKRDDLIPSLADILIPSSKSDDGKAKRFVVDLRSFDFEVVGLVHDNRLVVGISLNHYQYVGARSYCSGKMPPDITPPYIAGDISKTVIRLRPAIANLLYYVSNIQVGDIVIDPCAGVGTIPVEGSMQRCVAIGGDLALCCDEGLDSIVANYSKSAQNFQASNGIVGSSAMLSWDAISLPLRDDFVDHIISDLPFGLRCMSSSKLSAFLPLLFRECARCLRTRTGKMILLCGSYQRVLDALLQANAVIPLFANPQSIIPVNIGGISAWIVQVQRTDTKFAQIPNHRQHVASMVRGRSQSTHGTKRAQA